MEKTNLLLEIEFLYKEFTKVEKKIADFVLKNPQKILFMSITELAENCKVAEASVHRFCRALKIKGYQEFKMLLSLSFSSDTQEEDTSFQKRDGGILDDILQNHLNAIKETNSLLNEAEIKKAVDMMLAAGNIIFLGVGNSMITAEEAYGRFLHITPNVSYIADAHMQSMRASMAGREDVFVFFSYSGDTKDNVHVESLAHERGAGVVVITRYPKSELTKLADAVLICGSKESPLEGGSMGAKMSQLHIIDVLFQYYYQSSLEVSRINNRETARGNLDKFFN